MHRPHSSHTRKLVGCHITCYNVPETKTDMCESKVLHLNIYYEVKRERHPE